MIEVTPVDIICPQETFMKEGQKLTLPGYTEIRKDRPPKVGSIAKVGGGLCILLKSELTHTVLDCPHEIECQKVKVKTTSGFLNVAYVFTTEEARAFESLLQRSSCVVVGDL